MDKLETFLQNVKDGSIRGDYCQIPLSDTVHFELSVSTFEYGHVHLRLIVEDPNANNLPEGSYVQQLFRINSTYQDMYEKITSTIEKHNESNITNAHSWEKKDPHSEHPSIPNSMNIHNVSLFEDHIQIHDPLSLEEALKTNRNTE